MKDRASGAAPSHGKRLLPARHSLGLRRAADGTGLPALAPQSLPLFHHRQGTCMADIFLSYSRSDTNAAAKIVGVLEAEGWTVWWDTRLRAGVEWDKVIEREIEAARCVVVIWSPISAIRQWVRVEANFGLSNDKLVPVLIERAKPPLAFSLIQTTDLSTWDGDPASHHIRAFVEAVHDMLGKKPAALAPEPPVPTIDRARRDWEHIMASEDPREFRAFIRAHEDGPYVWKAQNRLEDLANAAWAEMVKEPGEAALKKFLEVHFDSKHREAAEKRLEKPGRRSVQQRIARETSREALLALWDDDPDAAEERFRVLGYLAVPLLENGKPESRWLKPGEFFRDLDIAPEMVVIRSGSFLMGSKTGEGEDDERPQHNVTIPRAFAAGRYPVTFNEWDAALAAGGVRHRPDGRSWGRGARPVINVSWNDAQAYIDWLNQKTGFIYRLLSEAEWEYACRASTTTAYSTGRRISRGQARFETLLGAAGKTEEAGSFPANPFGLHDMHGNVWEWCQDCWNSTYHGAPDDGSAWATGDCGQRVLRGGSFADESRFLRSAARNRSYKENSGSSTGFRVARELS